MPRGRTIQVKRVNMALLPEGTIDHSQPHRAYAHKVKQAIADLKAKEAPEKRLTHDRAHLVRVLDAIKDTAGSYAEVLSRPEDLWTKRTIAAHEKEMRKLWRKRDDLTRSISILEKEIAANARP